MKGQTTIHADPLGATSSLPVPAAHAQHNTVESCNNTQTKLRPQTTEAWTGGDISGECSLRARHKTVRSWLCRFCDLHSVVVRSFWKYTHVTEVLCLNCWPSSDLDEGHYVWVLGVSRSISWWTGKGTGKGGHGIDWKGNRERWTWHRLEREQGKVDMA